MNNEFERDKVEIIPAQPNLYALVEYGDKSFWVFRVFAFTCHHSFMPKQQEWDTTISPIVGDFSEGFESENNEVMFIGTKEECEAKKIKEERKSKQLDKKVKEHNKNMAELPGE